MSVAFGLKTKVVVIVLLLSLTLSLLLVLNSAGDPQQPVIRKLASLDVALPDPKPGDWLDVHAEKGQTFDQYVSQDPFLATSEINRIYIQPLGEFSSIEKQLIQHTAEYLALFFDRKTVILAAVSDTIVPPASRRNDQLQTGAILDYLERRFPKDAIAVMALTSIDLYPSPRYNFVFGQARPKTRVGVSSYFRYLQGPLDEANFQSSLRRIIKTSSHEIGHMLSCTHCTHAVCLMNGSNSLTEADSRPNRLCSSCLEKLHWNLRFDPEVRLSKLNGFFSRHSLKQDLELAQQDLKVLRAP